MEFDGASHYQFWGLLILNPKHHRTPLAVAEVLAHESGHSLLFGLTIDELLVFNSDEELYKSPLRTDPRPIRDRSATDPRPIRDRWMAFITRPTCPPAWL